MASFAFVPSGVLKMPVQIEEPRTVFNSHGQPLGLDLGPFVKPVLPEYKSYQGMYCRLEPLDPGAHGSALHACLAADQDGSIWTYTGPDELGGQPPSMTQVMEWLQREIEADGYAYTIIIPDGNTTAGALHREIAAGTVSCRLESSGTATIENVVHSPVLQGTRAATEAHCMVMEQLFCSGYRRVVWSCDAHNHRAVDAAIRLGFCHEATERYVGVQRRGGRLVSRSETYLTILGFEWPAVHNALRTWLQPSNFDETGKQQQRLSQLTATLRPPLAEPPSWPLVGEPHVATNKLGQLLGADLEGWTPPPLPPYTTIVGQHCKLEPLDARAHAQSLFEELRHDPHGLTFTYTGINGLIAAPTMQQVIQWLSRGEAQGFVYAIMIPAKLDSNNNGEEDWRAVGTLQHQSIQPEIGVASVGFVVHTPKLRGTIAGTEAHAMALRRLFDCGYRRVEWGCDSNNSASRRFALRLGFQPEGELRLTRGVIDPADPVSGNRHYSILDFQWPAVDAALQAWLAPSNFTDGVQHRRLEEFRRLASFKL